jgi:hypothetical protein
MEHLSHSVRWQEMPPDIQPANPVALQRATDRAPAKEWPVQHKKAREMRAAQRAFVPLSAKQRRPQRRGRSKKDQGDQKINGATQSVARSERNTYPGKHYRIDFCQNLLVQGVYHQ